MKKHNGARLLIVDDSHNVCAFMAQLVSSWGMSAEALTDPMLVYDRIQETYYNIFLLDVFMPGRSGLDLIPEILETSPDSKIIIMTGYLDKDIVIRALQLGAFDFLLKPIDREWLSQTVKRALELQKMEKEYERVCQDLACSRQELLAHKQKLGDANGELTETGKALALLAQNAQREKQEAERRIVVKTRSLIIPIIEKLKQNRDLKRYESELNMLIKYMEDLTTGLATDIRIATSLSFTELRVASLIKNGMTTDEIAEHLHISPSTVKTHRRNIRRKLGINNSSHNLRLYLQKEMASESKKLTDYQRLLLSSSP